MAANLGVGVGDRVSIGRAGMPDAHVRIDGIVDFTAPQQLLLPPAASTAATQAPVPDNVLIVPAARWRALFGALARAHPALVRRQVHANLTHGALPRDPSAAYARALGLARNFETRTAGTAVVGNNLATALDAARGDSLYARVAFLFLGLPGALLAALLTGAIAGAGADRRRRDQALLRARGATSAVLTRLALAESLLVGIAGGAVGLGAAAAIGASAFGSSSFGANATASAAWAGALACSPAWPSRRSRSPCPRGATRAGSPLRTRASPCGAPAVPGGRPTGLDLLAIAGAILVYRATSGGGAQLVLVAEGSTQVSVNYWSFLAPLLAWIGVALLSYRLAELCLAARPETDRARLAARLGRARGDRRLEHVAAARIDRAHARADRPDDVLRRHDCGVQRHLPAAGRGRRPPLERRRRGARRERSGRAAGEPPRQRRRKPRAVASTEPLQHRYAYIGRDLQDLYGVDATTSCAARDSRTRGSAGGTASRSARHARTHAERRAPERGGRARLPAAPGRSDHDARCSTQRTRRSIPVRFTYVGHHEGVPDRSQGRLHHRQCRLSRARRPTTPRVSTLLVQTCGSSPTAVGRRIRAEAGTSSIGQRHRDEPRADREQPHQRRAAGSDARRARLRARARSPRRRGCCCGSAWPTAAARSRSRTRSGRAPASSADSCGPRPGSSPPAASCSAASLPAG